MSKEKSGKKVKILFVMSFPPPFHGANLSNLMVWESDVQNEFECSLLDISDRRDLNNLGKFEFTNVYLGLQHLFQVFRQVIKMKPDVVYMLISQNKWAVVRDGAFILLVKAISRSKIVIHLRGAFFKHFYDNTNGWMKTFTDVIMKRVDAVIVLGNSLRFNFDQWIKNIYIVPNGTDVLLEYDVETKLMPKDEIVITYMSNFFKSKGIIEVLESVKIVKEAFPEKKITYKIAGAWGLDPILGLTAEEIKKEADAILDRDNSHKHIQFLGVITGENKLNLLKESDVFLLPTSYDGHPRAIIEAMAAGCPVISTDVGAISETVIDGETGFIIPEHDTKALSEKIILLIRDDAQRKAISRASRKRYEAHYTKEQFIQKMIQTFRIIDAQDKA